jgi:hypothetical protein
MLSFNSVSLIFARLCGLQLSFCSGNYLQQLVMLPGIVIPQKSPALLPG